MNNIDEYLCYIFQRLFFMCIYKQWKCTGIDLFLHVFCETRASNCPNKALINAFISDTICCSRKSLSVNIR